MAVYLLTTAAVLAAAFALRRLQPVQQHSAEYPYRETRAGAMTKILTAAIFVCLVIPEALRINVGNDYAKYVEFMHLIRSNAYVPTEIGFNFLVKVIYALCGTENYLLVFALFAAMTAALFLAAIRQQADDFAFSFFLFMMLGYYFQTYNTVRYYFALAIAVWSVKFLLRREYVPFVLSILLAATFHKSVLVVLVLYPLALIPWKKWQLACIAALLSTFLLFPAGWMQLIVALYPSYRDTDYLAGGSVSRINILRCAAVIILALLCAQPAEKGTFRRISGLSALCAGDRRLRFYFNCSLGALACYVFCSFIPFVSRIAYYLSFTQIFLIPALLSAMPGGTEREKKRRKILTGLTVAAAVLYFAAFLFKMSDENVRILPYQTFLFHDMPKTISEVTN
ncbi:MAG: EpsG family protein [Lachnospiraceae bacterium]|jgi:hypothetical protein|nr:EpsG family protein [Lachnospiraceae bacterium]